jgi:hypothetical protein
VKWCQQKVMAGLDEVEPERSTSKGKSDLRVPAMHDACLIYKPQDLSIQDTSHIAD